MARQPYKDDAQQTRFASRTAFENLAVDEGEDTDEELQIAPDEDVTETAEREVLLHPEPVSEPPSAPQPSSEAALSKSAAKRRARAARQRELEAQQEPSTLSTVASIQENLPVTQITEKKTPFVAEQEPEVPQPSTSSNAPSASVSASVSSVPPPSTAAAVPTKDWSGPSVIPDNKPVETPATTMIKESKPLENGLRQHTNGSLTTTSATPSEKTKAVSPSRTEDQTERQKKKQSFLVRTLWTFIMITGFLVCLAMGPSFMILLVLLIQMLVYREVTALSSLGMSNFDDSGAKDLNAKGKGKDPWSKTLNWYFYAVANYFLYGENLIYYFKHVIFADEKFLPFAKNHRFISFMLYISGFVAFVASLQKQYLKSQFRMFAWVHMSILAIVMSSHFIIKNIFEGLIWFWVPASLVICNDVFAYIFGITFGRTPLFSLSPKKTVEGFVGALFSTFFFALAWGTFFMQFDYMICPAENLGMNAFSVAKCQPNNVFVWREMPLSLAVKGLLGNVGWNITSISWAPYQLHLLVLACFASLVAPFGGFFASGFKRAFDIKDFGHSIPGHGGMTDRMDCQFLMGVFTWVYYSALIKEHHVTVGQVLQLIVSSLSTDEQVELVLDLQKYLRGKGISV